MNTPLPKALSFIPGKGHGSLPLSDPHTNANLLTVYADAQHDFLWDRLYLVSFRLEANANGEYAAGRKIVRLTDGPPSTAEHERKMLEDSLNALLLALTEKAAVDEGGRLSAPVHLIFWNEFVWHSLLAGLARHLNSLPTVAPAVYDLLTQKAAFASPMTTFLEQELHRKNFPLICPSLQNVASYLGFDWGSHRLGEGVEPIAYKDAFRRRHFDATGRMDTEAGDTQFFTARARFNSQMPLEYAYAAWGELPEVEDGNDPYRAYRQATPDLLRGLAKRRLLAMSHVRDCFLSDNYRGNPRINKMPFSLKTLGHFSDQSDTLAGAIQEFCLIERHVQLAQWRGERQTTPEERLLSGDTLLGIFHHEEQPIAIQEADGDPVADNTLIWLRLVDGDTGIDPARALALFSLRVGDRLVLSPRWSLTDWGSDGAAEFRTPSPEQLLYATRVEVMAVEGAQRINGPVTVALAVRPSFGMDGTYLFPSVAQTTLRDGAMYTLDPDPNSPLGKWQAHIANGLGMLEDGDQEWDEDDDGTTGIPQYHTLYDRLNDPGAATVFWPVDAAEGQARFLSGLDILHRDGLLTEEMEPAKRDLIGSRGDDPLLLVQGPPGTGKSTTTAFAILARIQGALEADIPLRALLCCKTHAATDVLLHKVWHVQERLSQIRDRHPDLFAEYFHPRLPSVTLSRLAPKTEQPVGIYVMDKDANRRQRRMPSNWDIMQAEAQCVVAGTPGGIYALVNGRWRGDPFAHKGCDLLVLDEASQMSLPEAMLAALPLVDTGQVIVVGDPRQMPPIVAHDWKNEPRRTFQRFQAFQSLYNTLLPLGVPEVKFERSFRVHRDVAEFLRREVYQRDGIDYHSTNQDRLPRVQHDDPFVAAVLDPNQPIVVVVHDEEGSQTHNPFEQSLLAPILGALADPFRYHLDAETGLGVVVPHRAQRAALQQRFPGLADAIDTVERYQGGEREVVVISATESDPDYLAQAGEFLFNSNRMVVALSRAKKKLILVASRAIFSHRSLDDDLFRAAALWKNLLRRTCPERLWRGEREGHGVTVWGTEAE